MRIKLLLIIHVLLFSKITFAQDVHFSQFYSQPMYLNPALTGSSEKSRLGISYRNQWPNIPNTYISQAVSFDQHLPGINSGIGLMVIKDAAGAGELGYTNVAGAYSYQAQFSESIGARAGVSVGYTNKSVDFSRLLFNDQISRGGGVTFETDPGIKVQYLDISFGSMIFSENFWIGLSGHHLNQPDQSLLDGESPLPIKMGVQGGYKAKVNQYKAGREQSVSAAFSYAAQGNYDKLAVGAYFVREPLVTGVWYNGIPVFKSYEKGYTNNDAFTVLMGYQINNPNLRIGYSYDLTISKLVTNSGGAHEVSLIYEFDLRDHIRLSSGGSRRRSKVSCPSF